MIPQQRKLVTTHDALGYYANAYGLKLKAQAFSTEEQPTAAIGSKSWLKRSSASVPTIFAEVDSEWQAEPSLE